MIIVQNKSMKKILIILTCMLCTGVYCQSENLSKEKELVQPKEKATWSTPKTNSSWWKNYSDKKENHFLKLPEKNIDFTGKSPYVQRKIDLPKNLIPSEGDHIDVAKLKGDKYFGDFINNGNYLNVYCRDHSAIDGDLVNILLNDEVVVENVYLTYNFKGFNIPLKPGFNKIEFIALNEGDSRPNTAEFQVLDENGNVIVAEQWYLLTGYKARFIIVKE